MNRKIGLPLASALIMFPQVVETIYSTTLVDIQHTFAVSNASVSRTLSLFFVAFALGIVCWGQLCDRVGRRPVMLAGLFIFGAAACSIAVGIKHFDGFLCAWGVLAFGSAVGSNVTQTVLRDNFTGTELAHVFSIIMMSLSISPALGLFSGAAISHYVGYRGVFAGMTVMAVVLFGWAFKSMPETRPPQLKKISLLATSSLMLRDPHIWRSALLVALFNVCVFSYYSLAPFMFQQMGLSDQVFGYTGLVMAAGSAAGALLNRIMLHRGWTSRQLTCQGSVLALLGGIGVLCLQASWLFILPMVLVVLGFGIAIPNVLSEALTRYRDRMGVAGSILGLIYYLMIGGGLGVAAWGQNLATVLIVSSAMAIMASRKTSH